MGFNKNKRFLDLSNEDLFEDNYKKKEVIKKVHPVASIKNIQQDSSENFKKKNIKFNSDINNADQEFKKDVKILDGLVVIQKDPSLDKGVHFYTEKRIYEKLRNFSKKNNISISKLLSTIIDKAISDE